MTRSTPAALLFLVLSILSAPAVPVLARHHSRSISSGPIYSSAQAIEDAQAILEKGKYLEPGRYQKGKRDQETINAIRAFQRDHFIRPSGLLDPETMALLTSHGRKTAPD